MMNLRIAVKSCLLIILSSLSFLSQASATLPSSLSPVLKKVMPAIVNVAVQGYINPSDLPKNRSKDNNSRVKPLPRKPKKFNSIGSGVILSPSQGYIVTNAHVIRNASLITITLYDGRRLKAKAIGEDPASDIAILKVSAKHLPNINIGNSSHLKVGDFVVAIGNPFGLNSYGNNQTATFGMVSALQRNTLNIEGIENFIQTDAAINPGNSGGALINIKGELIGINTAILAPYGGNVGIGFAIPINMVRDVASQLIKYGSVHRGLMGVFVQHLTPELAQAFDLPEQTKGALITQINPNSPADRAGLKVGDIITHINSTPITEAAQVKTVISLLRVGTTVDMQVLRNKKLMRIHAVVSDVKQHEQKEQAANPFFYGIAFNEIFQQNPLHGLIEGVQVVGASESSMAWRAGLRPGDVITDINHIKTTRIKDILKIAKNPKHKQLLLRVIRGAGSFYIVLK